jgi:rhodanese-related sulfurtransferase
MRRHVMVNTAIFSTRSTGFIQFAVKLQFILLAMVLGTAMASAQPVKMMVNEAYEAAQSGEIILVDIRTPEEWAETGIGDGAIALDMTQKSFIPDLIRLRERNPDTKIAFICATGGRSGYLNRFLWQNGFKNTTDVVEGMLGSRAGPGWIKTGLPIYPGVDAQIKQRLEPMLPAS